MTPLDDGSYDAFIVWAEPRDNGVALELTITTGAPALARAIAWFSARSLERQ